MGKKIPEIMAEERERFIQGGLSQGYSQELAEEVFALVEPFAGYAFGKAHAVSYGLISYWTAYLKANYPAEYMVSLLNAYAGNLEKVATSVAEARRLKIPVLPPDVNHSALEFSIENLDDGRQAIRFGLAVIKNVGPTAVQPIVEGREKGPYTSVEHMCRVADLSAINRKALESLIKAGAFDELGERAAILEVAGRILSLANSEASLRSSGQTSMFDLFGETVPTPLANLAVPDVTTTMQDIQAWEQEVLGFPLSINIALGELAMESDGEAIVSRGQIGPEMAGRQIELVGQVSSASHRQTRDERPYTLATLSLLDGSTIDLFVWENVQQLTLPLWTEGKMLRVVGEVRVRGDRLNLTCIRATEFVLSDDDQESTPADGQRQDTGMPHRELGHREDERAVDGGAAPAAAERPGPAYDRDGDHDLAVPAAPSEGGSRRLSLLIRESDQAAGDQHLLEEVRRLLLDYLGEDEVALDIETEGRIVTLEWPVVRVNASPELERRLQELLGPAGRVLVEERVS